MESGRRPGPDHKSAPFGPIAPMTADDKIEEMS